jgi:hypothetical protein
LIQGVEYIVAEEATDGHGYEIIPFLRGSSTDLNFTLASSSYHDRHGSNPWGTRQWRQIISAVSLALVSFFGMWTKKRLGPFEVILPFINIFVGYPRADLGICKNHIVFLSSSGRHLRWGDPVRSDHHPGTHGLFWDHVPGAFCRSYSSACIWNAHPGVCNRSYDVPTVMKSTEKRINQRVSAHSLRIL